MAKKSSQEVHSPIPKIKESRVVSLPILMSHPRNYRIHPADEIEHLMESIRTHGIYRNVVIAQDGRTILAGHGVVEAARRLGMKEIPVVQTDYAPDDPRALKLLVGDNEIQHLVENDDRALTELLRELKETDTLLGTGYDEMMLANLVMVSRPAAEIEDLDAASHWVGMPEYDMEGEHRIQIIVNFVNEDDKKEFCQLLGIDASSIAKEGAGKSIWWPKKPDRDDRQSVWFTDDEETDEDEEEYDGE